MAHEIWPHGPEESIILFDDWEDFGVAMKELINKPQERLRKTGWTIRINIPGEGMLNPFGTKQVQDGLKKYSNSVFVTRKAHDDDKWVDR